MDNNTTPEDLISKEVKVLLQNLYGDVQQIKKEVTKLGELVTGNGHPENGLILKVDRIDRVLTDRIPDLRAMENKHVSIATDVTKVTQRVDDLENNSEQKETARTALRAQSISVLTMVIGSLLSIASLAIALTR